MDDVKDDDDNETDINDKIADLFIQQVKETKRLNKGQFCKLE